MHVLVRFSERQGNVSHLENAVYTLIPTTGSRLRTKEKRDSIRENRKGTGVDSTRGDELVSREYRNTNNGSTTQTSLGANLPLQMCLY